MPFANLPWMSNSDQFLRAIIAGSELGESRAKRFDEANAARRPQFGGGGGYRPLEVRESAPQPTLDPHLVLNGSILSMVNPSEVRNESVAPPKPFDVAGQQFITNPATGQIESYVEPSQIEKVGNDLVRVYPKSFKAEKLYEGGNPPAEHLSLSTVDTTGMDENQRALQAILSPPRLSGAPSAISNYLANASAPQIPSAIVPKSTEVIRLTPDGKRAVFNSTTKQFLRYAD